VHVDGRHRQNMFEAATLIHAVNCSACYDAVCAPPCLVCVHNSMSFNDAVSAGWHLRAAPNCAVALERPCSGVLTCAELGGLPGVTAQP